MNEAVKRLPQINTDINRLLMYMAAGYVLIDYLLRSTSASASIWDEVLFILVVGTWTLVMAFKARKPQAGGMLIPLLVFYTSLVVVYIVNHQEPAIAMMEFRAIVEYSFWFFLAVNLFQDSKQVKIFCDLFLLVGLLVALYGIYQYIIGVDIPITWVDRTEAAAGDIRTRVFSFIGSPNVLGSFMVVQISIAFASFKATKNWIKKRIYLLACGAYLLCMIFTFSRGAWLVFFMVFILLSLWLDKRIILILVILSILTPIAVPSVYNRVSYMLSPQYVVSSTEGGRMRSWSQAADYWGGSPWTGLGLGRYGGGVAIANFPGSAVSLDNYYLKLGTETGIIGFSAFMFLVLCVLRQGRRRLSQISDPYLAILAIGIFGGLIAILAHNVVENLFEFPLMSFYFWFLFGVLVALPQVRAETGEETNG